MLGPYHIEHGPASWLDRHIINSDKLPVFEACLSRLSACNVHESEALTQFPQVAKRLRAHFKTPLQGIKLSW